VSWWPGWSPRPARRPAKIDCAEKVSGGFLGIGGGSDFYDDPKASDRYDALFSKSHAVPHLNTHVPQGMATWSNWKGDQDLLLITSYEPSSDPGRESNSQPADPADNSYIIALDAKTGQHVGTVELTSFHAGGIAVFEKLGWAFVPNGDPAGGKVSKYPLDRLRQAIRDSKPDSPTPVEPEGADQPVYATSFLTSHGPTDTLWAGKFNKKGREFMRSYTVSEDGKLTERDGQFQVPAKTQGLVVTDDVFVYSTSSGRKNRSNIYVVQRGEGSSDLDKAKLSCFRAPTMSEGMAVYGDDVHLVYESGASYYLKDDCKRKKDGCKPDNVIKDLHKAPLAELARLLK
jgi:hypothetical protein